MSGEVETFSDIAARVIREHEPRPMGCACGAQIGDDIDRRWHLVNQTIAAVEGRCPHGSCPMWRGEGCEFCDD